MRREATAAPAVYPFFDEVVAGAGPFLLPVATGLLAAGVEVVGVFEAGRPGRYARSPTRLPSHRG